MPAADLTAAVIPFALVLTRLTGLILGLPMLTTEIAPLRIRAGIVIVLSLALTFAAPPIAVPESLALALLMEFLLGTALGLLVRLAVAAAEMAGELCGVHLGFGFNQIVDPLTQQPTGPLTRLLSAIVGIMLFATESHHDVIRALVGSFYSLPPGTVGFDSGWTVALVQAGRELFAAAVRIALPLIFIALATHLSFGLLTRVAPQLNLWAIGFLASIAVGLVSLSFFAPSLTGEVRHLLVNAVYELQSGPVVR